MRGSWAQGVRDTLGPTLPLTFLCRQNFKKSQSKIKNQVKGALGQESSSKSYQALG
jgi:hypothetical protein